MTISLQIKAHLLKTLLAAEDAPLPSSTLHTAVFLGFPHVALTAADIDHQIKQCEAAGLTSGTLDELLGLIWSLTPKGKIRAQQL